MCAACSPVLTVTRLCVKGPWEKYEHCEAVAQSVSGMHHKSGTKAS